MTDIQAAIGLVQLSKLDTLVQRRRELAQRYQDRLSGLPGVLMIADPPGGTTNYQSFWVLLPDSSPCDRNQLMARLGLEGISARRGIMAAHLEPAYASQTGAPLPVTEMLTSQSLILPLFHQMTESEQDRVVTAMVGALEPVPA